MPIKGISNIRRLPRAGKIRLGIKVPVKGKPDVYRPAAVDYFVCPDEVTAVYGDKPKSLDIMFPVEDEEKFFSQFYKMYTAGGLKCRGDGEDAMRLDETGAMVPYECKGEDCPDYVAKKCKRIGILQFMLPNVEGIGVYQISTSSFHSIVNVNSDIDFIRALCGRIRMIPLRLTVIPQQAQPDGKKKIVHVLKIDNSVKLADLQAAAQIDARRVALPAPDEDEEDLLVTPEDDDVTVEVIHESDLEPVEQPTVSEVKAATKVIKEVMDEIKNIDEETEEVAAIEAEIAGEVEQPSFEDTRQIEADQIEAITGLKNEGIEKKKFTEKAFADALGADYGVTSLNEMRYIDADALIRRLQISVRK